MTQNKRTIAILDCSFDGRDRSGSPLVSNMPLQDGLIPKWVKRPLFRQQKRVNLLVCMMEIVVRRCLILWADLEDEAEEDKDGWVSLEEAVNYVNMITEAQSIEVTGYIENKKSPKQRKVCLYSKLKIIRLKQKKPVDYIPVGMLFDDVSLNDLLNELKQQRTFELKLKNS